MALLGSTVDPRLFVQDYSGFTRAADIQAQSMANIGANVGSVIKGLGEDYKDKKQLEAGIKATVTGIESAIKMGESLGIRDIKSSLTPYLDKINDPNVSPIEAAAYAKEASNTISDALGFGMKANEMGIEKARYEAGVAARIAESQDSKWQSYDKEIAIDGQKVKVTGSLDQFGQFKDINNNVYPSVADAFSPAKQAEPPLAGEAYPDGMPTVGTPMGGPGVLPLDKQNKAPEPPINFDFNQFPSVSGDAKVPPEVVANIEAAGQVPVAKTPAFRLPPGASIVTDKPEIRMTAQQVQDLAVQGFKVSARPIGDGNFMVSGSDIGGQAGETFEMLPGGGMRFSRGGGGGKAGQPTVKLGEGQQLVPDKNSPTGTRVENIPGGAAEQAVQQAASAEVAARSRAIEIGKIAISEIDRFIDYTGKMSKLPLASPARKILGAFGMEEQAEAQSSLDTVSANLKFEALDGLRKNSPTGSSGLGQVTQNEFSALADQWGTLRLVGDPEKIRERAISVKTKLLDVVHGNQQHRESLLKKGVITSNQYNEIQSQYPGEQQAAKEDDEIKRYRDIFSPKPTQ